MVEGGEWVKFVEVVGMWSGFFIPTLLTLCMTPMGYITQHVCLLIITAANTQHCVVTHPTPPKPYPSNYSYMCTASSTEVVERMPCINNGDDARISTILGRCSKLSVRRTLLLLYRLLQTRSFCAADIQTGRQCGGPSWKPFFHRSAGS